MAKETIVIIPSSRKFQGGGMNDTMLSTSIKLAGRCIDLSPKQIFLPDLI